MFLLACAAMSDSASKALFERARAVIPGGVNSPVRAFRAVGGEPVFVARAAGARIYGADGAEYIDYVGSWGPAIVGHAHPAVLAALESEGVKVVSVTVARPSLDDVYLRHAGKAFSEADVEVTR